MIRAVGLTCFHRVGGEDAFCVSSVSRAFADVWPRAAMALWCTAAKRVARTANPQPLAEMNC